jgi:glutaminase
LTEFNRRDALLAAITACGAAAEVLLARFREEGDTTLERSFKPDGGIVTNADIAADEAIKEALGSFDVTGRVESEESTSGDEDSELRWVVDPLCGTAPYAAGLGTWGVNVALMAGTTPLLGAISLPTMRETLTCVSGRGVSRNGKPWTPEPPVGKLSEQLVDLEINGPELAARMMSDGSLSWVRGVDHTTTFASMAYPLSQLCLGRLAGVELGVDDLVSTAELASGHRNQALAAFLKSFGNLSHSVEEVLELYVSHCAVSMSCVELARAGLFLAKQGVVPDTGERILDASQTKRLNALMLTCGTYDAVGDFAYRVGLPGKSGVGGGILAILPGVLAVCVWSPGLGPSGNSLAGTLALELLTTKLGRSIF